MIDVVSMNAKFIFRTKRVHSSQAMRQIPDDESETKLRWLSQRLQSGFPRTYRYLSFILPFMLLAKRRIRAWSQFSWCCPRSGLFYWKFMHLWKKRKFQMFVCLVELFNSTNVTKFYRFLIELQRKSGEKDSENLKRVTDAVLHGWNHNSSQ